MKPQPCHHKDFGCVRFLVSDQGALPAPPTRPISRTFPLQENGSGLLWGHGASQAPGSARESAREGLIEPQHLKAPCSAANLK